jgi:circadian clock protein KaiC
LNAAVSRVGAKRVVLDSIDTLFAGIPNEAILRSELRRLFVWLKDARIFTSLLWPLSLASASSSFPTGRRI